MMLLLKVTSRKMVFIFWKAARALLLTTLLIVPTIFRKYESIHKEHFKRKWVLRSHQSARGPKNYVQKTSILFIIFKKLSWGIPKDALKRTCKTRPEKIVQKRSWKDVQKTFLKRTYKKLIERANKNKLFSGLLNF